MWRVDGDAGGRFSGPTNGEDMVVSSWVCGSIPMDKRRFLKCVFHRFLISLSVLPGICAAIAAHLEIQNPN
ncbi:hypothetical protein Hanom_Chr04g00282811 [Helianthus anomalus]